MVDANTKENTSIVVVERNFDDANAVVTFSERKIGRGIFEHAE